MGGNVQCPVCTLFLLPGMDLSDHLETHPKEQVIKALVQMSLKSEVSEIVTPDTPSNKTPTFGQNDVNARATEEDNRSRTPTSEASECVEEISEKRRELEENVSLPPIPQHISMNKECGYLFENNNSNSSSSSSSNIFGPPTPYYHQHNHQQQQQQQLQQQHQQHQHHQQHNHHQQQSSSSQHHLQSYHPYHGHPHGGSNTPMGPGPSQPPLRLFSYQQPPKPLQPPPAYGAAISQLRSQNSQSQMVNNVNRTPYSPANYTPTSSASTTASPLSATSSRLPPPLPPPPLNQRYQPSFTQMNPSFTDSCDNSAMSSPRRTSMTPPVRAPPQLYRSPMSSSGGQYSRQSSSPYSVMTGSPSVLRFAESPVTAHYLERENGDFIVQETPKHVVECVEKDDGEFSVIERVYHMPPSVLQINEDHDDDRSIISDQGSNSEDMKMLEDDRPSGTWSGGLSPEQQIDVAGRQKNSGITVLSDVQLDINEYLDLMGNIIASSKVAKTRTELIKIEKFEPDEVKEEIGSGAISPDIDEDVIEDEILPDNDQKPEDSKEEQFDYRNKSPCCPVPMPYASPSVAEPQDVNKDEILPAKNDQKPEDSKDEEFGYRDKSSCCPVPTLYASPSVVVPASSVTSVIRLAANPHARSNTPSIIPTHQHVDETRTDSPETKDEKDAAITTETLQITKVEEDVTICMETAKPNAEVATTSTDATTTAKVEKSTNEPQPQTDKIEDTDTPQIQEKSLKQEENPQFPSYHQLFRRPVKKTPKKLIIKPRSKPHTPPSVVPPSVPLPTPIEEEKSPIAREPTPQKEEVVTQVPETTKEDKLDDIKSENLPAPATAESLPPPLYADADEKIPPDDDVQPSTSNGILPMQEEVAVSVPSSTVDDDKPTADLTAFLDQCMKKEEEAEEQQMQTIFTIQITDAAEMDVSGLSPPSSPHAFPSASLFSKPTNSIDNMSTSESVLPDSSDMHEHDLPHPEPSQSQHQQNNSAYVEYPFSFLYSGEANHQEDSKNDISPPMYCSEDFNKYSASTSGGNSASCTWYQSQSSENDFEIDGKGSYLDLDSCKRSASFAAATEGSMPTTDTLNIRTDEKMPAKGEISEQESNCGVENSWSQPLYNEFPVRFPNPYQTFMTTQESWSNENFFRPQDLSSSVETKNFSLRLVEESPIMDALPSTSKRKNKPAVAKVPRKKTFQCAHCSLNFPLLKEKNAHLIKQHGYKRVNRRLVRDPPTSTVTTATMYTDAGASLLLGLEPSPLQLPPLAEEEDSKAAIVKIEQDNKEPKDCKNTISSLAITSTVATPTTASVSRTKYDSMRARDNRMLINFNLNALNVKNEGKAEGEEAQSYYQESKSSFVCFVCRKDFLTVKLFDEHLAEHPAECYRCHKTFTRWKNFMVHLKRHLGWKDFGCTICEKKFVIRSALVEHMRMHTGQTPLKCKICGKSFKRYSNLTQHRKRHGNRINRNKEYVCYCGEVLPSKARFIWHKETHDSKPKCCPYCRDRFVHANSLRRHIRLAHSEKFDYTEPMECPMCKQIYAKSSIKAHMATHSMDTQHDCPICNKSFSTKWNLKIHSWVHANRTTKPFKCDQCVKAFVREVDYNNHINSHKQIKPYTCEHCGCKFIRKYNYIRHRREHHGNKKFTCDLCGKLFHRHYYLIEHRRIHTGERPFQCTICGKSSTTKTNHNKHLKIHHSRDPFTSEA